VQHAERAHRRRVVDRALVRLHRRDHAGGQLARSGCLRAAAMPVGQSVELVVVQCGGDLAGVHQRERHARTAQLVPQRLAEHALGRLGGAVYGCPGERAVGGARGEQHDVALGAVEQVGQRGVDGVDGAQPVHPRHALDGGQVHLAERPVGGHAGVGDDQVEAAGRGDEGLDGGGDGVGIGHIARQHVVRTGERRR